LLQEVGFIVVGKGISRRLIHTLAFGRKRCVESTRFGRPRTSS
jgi:hypothetical protein